MNMPVLPVTSSSTPPADASVRGADAASTDAPAFSNVLSQQQSGAARPADAQPVDARQAGKTRADADAAEPRDPLGPDETLSLILDSAALPLMQAAAATTETRTISTAGTAGRDGTTAHAAARLPADIAASVAAESHDGARSAQTGQTDDSGSRLRTSRIDTAIAPATPAATRLAALPADVSAPGADRGRDAGLARPAAVQPAIQSARQFSIGQAGIQAADPAAPTQSAAAGGPDPIQIATSNAALAPAAAPAAASLLPGATPAPTTVPVAVPTPLSNPQWPQDFSRQILQLTQSLTGAGHTVQMHVNPPELGPIHITLHVGDSITQASFVSPHASVRQALENALPHLEQQLAQAGLSLGQADVGDQQPGQQAQQQTAARNGESTFSLDGSLADAASLPAGTPAPRAPSRPDALVDTFA